MHTTVQSHAAMATGNRRTIRSVENAYEILNSLRSHGPSTVSALSDRVDLSPGSIHTHLATLKQYGLIQQDGDTYRLGLNFIIFGENVRNRMPIYEAARNEIDDLAHSCGAFAHQIVEHGGKLIVIYEAFSDDAIGKEYYTRERDSPMTYVHCSSAGKAILAHLPERRVDNILDVEGLPEMTPRTITNRERFKEELEKVRERGVAFNDKERMAGIRAVGAPIIHDNGTVLGAVSVSGPASEWTGEQYEEDLPKRVSRAANAVEVNLHAEMSAPSS